MSTAAAPTDLLMEAARAAGLIETGLTNWRFAELAKVLAIPERRRALALALAELAPEVEPGWHEIVREDPVEVHLVADLPDADGAGWMGVGVRVAKDFDDGPSGQASLVVPLIGSVGGGDARVVAGEVTHPVELRVEAGIADDGPFASIGLLARFSATPTLAVVVRGGGGRAADEERTLDLEDLPGLAIEVVGWAAGASAGLASMIATVVGQGPGTPVLDLGELLSRPEQAGETLRSWIASLDDSALRGWLGALGGLVTEAPAPLTPTGAGTAEAPWSVPFIPGAAPLRLTLARRGSGTAATLEVGLAAEAAAPPAAGVTAGARVGVALLSIPLAAGLPPRLGLTGDALVTVARTEGLPLVSSPAARCGAIVAGVRWNDALRPVLELRGVAIGGAPEQVLDLTSPDAVAAAAGGAIDALLTDIIGGAGRLLGVLSGLTAPETDVGMPPIAAVPVTALIADPAGSIRAHHRGLLADGRWWLVLREIARALGRDEPVAGAGTAADPWRVTLLEGREPARVLLELIAWDDGGSDGIRRLRLGVGLTSSVPPVEGGLRLALAAVDLPPPGAAVAIRLLGDASLSLGVGTGDDWIALPDGSLLRGEVSLSVGWIPGSLPTARARMAGLRLATPQGAEVPLPEISLPSPEGVAAIPAAALAALAAAALPVWLGAEGALLARTLGLGGAAWAQLGSNGSPADAVLAHAQALLLARDDEGFPAIAGALAALEDMVSGLGGRAADGAGSRHPGGAGTRDAPWLLGDGPAEAVVAHVWLEPHGSALRRPSAPPPPEEGEEEAPVARPDLSELLRALAAAWGGAVPGVGEIDPARDGAAIERLVAAFAGGDGRLTAADQLPVDEGWLVEPPVTAFHDEALADATIADVVTEAIEEIRQAAVTPPPVLVVAGADRVPGAWDDIVPSGMAGGWSEARTGGGSAAADAAVVADALAQSAAATTIVVAHGADAAAALAGAHAHPARVAGLVLVAPALAAAPAPGEDHPEALRLAARLVNAAEGEPALRACLAARVAELDGWRPVAGGLPAEVAAPARRAANPAHLGFDRAPVVVVPVRLPPLEDELRAAIAALTAAAPPAPDPVRVRVGATARLPVPDAVGPGAVRVEARLRAGGLGPQEGPGDAGLSIEARVERVGGWLVGGPGAEESGERVRALVARVNVAWTGTVPAITAAIDLIDAGRREPLAPRMATTHPSFDPLLARVAGVLSEDAGTTPAGPAAWALRALERLGIVGNAPGGGHGVVRDALDALRFGGAAELIGPRVRSALLGGFGDEIGLAGPSTGPWTIGGGLGRFTLEGRVPGWALSVATATPVPLGSGVTLDARSALSLGRDPASARAGHVELALGPCALRVEEGRPPELRLPGDAPIVLDRGLAEEDIADLGRRLAVSAIATLLAPTVLGPAVRLLPIDGLVRDPAGWLAEAGRLGAAAGPDAVRIGELVRLVAAILGATPAGDGTVPLGTAARLLTPLAPADPLGLELDPAEVAEGVRVGGALGVSLGASPQPTGELTVALALPAAAPWTEVALRAALGPAGPRLALAPVGAAGPEAEIELFPGFAGLAVLSTGIAGPAPRRWTRWSMPCRLRSAPCPPPRWRSTDALGLRADQAGRMRFAAAPDRFEALAAGDLMGALAVTPDVGVLATRAAQVLAALGVPLTAVADGPDVAIGLTGVPVRALLGTGEPAFGADLGPLTAGVARLDRLKVRVALPPGAPRR